MAAHNEVRVIGYLTKDVMVYNDETTVFFTMRVKNRRIDAYSEEFQTVGVYFDGGGEMMKKIRELKKFDLVSIKGVVNVMPVSKESVCPKCMEKNIKIYGVMCYIYPNFLYKIRHLNDEEFPSPDSAKTFVNTPEGVLKDEFTEVSNNIILLGNVVNQPELVTMKDKFSCCRYMLGIDRQYYIKTQDDLKIDYPWVYSYGKQKDMDIRYLKPGALVLVFGFLRNRYVKSNIVCEYCGEEYQYNDVATEIIPYSVEYLRGYHTADELED